MELSIRPMLPEDVPLLTDYWQSSSREHLLGMGADPDKLPGRTDMEAFLQGLLDEPVERRSSYAVIWLVDGQPAGHSNVNQLTFGEQGKMHLHLWNTPHRRRGMGAQFVRLSVPHFFEVLQLKTLLCEPFAKNPAPNKTLPKAGFQFVKTYRTTPGSINFEQEVNQWMISREML